MRLLRLCPFPQLLLTRYRWHSLQTTFGYTDEELVVLLKPMAENKQEARRLDGRRHPARDV